MDRRQFLQGSAMTLVGAAASPAMGASAERGKPNVLYVFSDQHRAMSLPGDDVNSMVAPNIDAFRRQNFSMERCISNYPLCTPYRGILISGRWPYQTGITRNNVPIGVDRVSLGQAFKDAGYRTAYVGKWHLQGNDRSFVPPGPGRQGFDDWHAWGNTNAHYRSWTYDPDTGARIQPPGWNGTTMTDQAIEILRHQPKGQPWFMVVSWNPPHPPFNPPKVDADLYPAENLKLRPNVRLSLEGKTAPGPSRPLTSEAAMRQATQGYYGGITGIDVEFGRLLKALDDTGQAQDTIVVYTSDHGEMLGSQGRMSKQAPFEESCRVPFFVRYPGVTPQGRGSEALFAAIDIFPTLCGLAGLAVPQACAGRDLSAILRGQGGVSQDIVFLMNETPERAADSDDEEEDGAAAGHRGREGPGHIDFVNLPSFRGARTDTHTYAVDPSGRWCLYDNIADPYQMKNLVRDPAQRPLIETFDAAIMRWLGKVGDPFPYAQAIRSYSTYPT